MPVQAHASDPLTVGDVARRSGVAISAIHFYESKGLIQGWRTDGNQRRYPRGVLRRIAVIRIAQRAGIPLSDIKTCLASIPAHRAPTKEDWHRLTTAWQAMLDDRIANLLQLRDELESCIGCGCLSLTDCPLRNPDDRLAAEGPGPRILQKSGPCPGAGRAPFVLEDDSDPGAR
jgi:MerR family redox-sensitive transcriptional activator SoxR